MKTRLPKAKKTAHRDQLPQIDSGANEGLQDHHASDRNHDVPGVVGEVHQGDRDLHNGGRNPQ